MFKMLMYKIRAWFHRDITEELEQLKAKITPEREKITPDSQAELQYLQSLIDGSDLRNFDGHGVSIISFSQLGQDKIVEAILYSCGIKRPTYLDIGANHPVFDSNTALFYRAGSVGVCVDADRTHKNAFDVLRPRDQFVNAAITPAGGGVVTFHLVVGDGQRSSILKPIVDEYVCSEHGKSHGLQLQPIEVDAMSVMDIVDNYCNGQFPHYLSIDVEGLDYDVLQATDFSKSFPLVISIEARGREINALLEEKGFVPLMCIYNVDTIAVHKSVVDRIMPRL